MFAVEYLKKLKLKDKLMIAYKGIIHIILISIHVISLYISANNSCNIFLFFSHATTHICITCFSLFFPFQSLQMMNVVQ